VPTAIPPGGKKKVCPSEGAPNVGGLKVTKKPPQKKSPVEKDQSNPVESKNQRTKTSQGKRAAMQKEGLLKNEGQEKERLFEGENAEYPCHHGHFENSGLVTGEKGNRDSKILDPTIGCAGDKLKTGKAT